MIEKGKIPVAVISFDLNPTKPGKVYQYRSPFYDLSKGDIVVVNNKNGIALARVVDVNWVLPGPTAAESTCIIEYIAVEKRLTEAMRTQAVTHADACKELQQSKQQRKEEIEKTVRELHKEILELMKELDTL